MGRIRFLLVGVNAKYIHLNPALYSLKYSVSEKMRDNVSVAEYTINHVYENVLMDIFQRRPDVIGFSCYLWNMEMITRLCDDLAKILPETDIWLGGPEAAWAGDEIFRRMPSVTGIMYGEGEAVFPGLLSAYVRGNRKKTGERDPAVTRQERQGTCLEEAAEKSCAVSSDILARIPGLRFPAAGSGITDGAMSREARGGSFGAGKHIVTTAAPRTMNMDDLPFIYDKEVEFANRIIYYESSRGCPFRCSYCLSAVDKIIRYRSLPLVFSELQWFLDLRVPQVKFLDRTFNSSRERTRAIWQYLIDHDNGVTNFHFEITADLLGQEEIGLLARMRPGLAQLEIGVQSTNPDTLRAINRHVDFGRLAAVVKQIGHGENVHQHLDLIAGLPWEDAESFARSFNDVYALGPSQLQLGFLKVLKGSPIGEQTEEFGLIYRGGPPYEVLSTRWLSYDDIVRLKGVEETVETYYNSHQFELTLEALVREYPSPFALYEALAAWSRRMNPGRRSLSRTGVYEQLHRFIHENFVNRAEVFDTLLTMDYYLRENARSRPGFAAGKEISWPGHARDYHVEEIGFDLELFRRTGETRGGRERWVFDYTCRSAISNNARMRKENLAI